MLHRHGSNDLFESVPTETNKHYELMHKIEGDLNT